MHRVFRPDLGQPASASKLESQVPKSLKPPNA